MADKPKDEVADKRGQPQQDKGKAKEHYEKLNQEVKDEKGKDT